MRPDHAERFLGAGVTRTGEEVCLGVSGREDEAAAVRDQDTHRAAINFKDTTFQRSTH